MENRASTKKEIEAHYRSTFSAKVHGKRPIDIIRDLTFDGVAPHVTLADMDQLLQYVHKYFLKGGLKGVGLEVGAGCGAFSAALACAPEVERVYGVEICEPVVRDLMPTVGRFVLGDELHKLIGVVGEFDNLEMEDNSVDFVFDFFSLHHSSDIKRTFTEIYRILKPGGFIFCFDKARGNSLTYEDLEKLLDQEYTRESKIKMGVDPDVKLTRRMNGEKEYRLKDWQEAARNAGFSTFEHFHIAGTTGSKASIVCKKMLEKLPPRLQPFVTNLLFFHKGNRNNLEIHNRVYTHLIENFPKEISLMIAYK